MAVISIIEKFPVELRQGLLAALSDVSSLRSAVLSCSSLYHAFLGAEELITTQVVENQLGSDVLPEAVAALKSSRLQPWTRQGVVDFVDHHLHSRMSPLDSWTLSEALPLGNLHSSVERFASEFIAEMLNVSSEFAYIDAPPGWPVSRQEMNRVQRAFYRFEVYCNLFRNPRVFEASEIGDLFFFKWSHWENEQLACVHDYLFRAVCPGMNVPDPCRDSELTPIAFNDLAEHDILWGELSVNAIDVIEYGDDFDSPAIQHLLSRGLVCLRQIVDADSYEARHRLLYRPYPDSNWDFLYEALMSEAHRSNDDLYLSDYTQEDEAKLARDHAPFVHDPDNGPADAWRWAHQDETRCGFVYSTYQTALRARGYCMWDRARLDEWSVFQQPWEPPDNPHRGDQQTSHKAEMQMSWRRRSEIHLRGGEGWWSVADESKVVWPGGKNPFDVPLRKKRSWGLKYG